MALAKTKPVFTVEEYLKIDRTEDERYEFLTAKFTRWRAKAARTAIFV
jgi:hypothetical protein